MNERAVIETLELLAVELQLSQAVSVAIGEEHQLKVDVCGWRAGTEKVDPYRPVTCAPVLIGQSVRATGKSEAAAEARQIVVECFHGMTAGRS